MEGNPYSAFGRVAQRWADSTGSAPSMAVLDRWQAEYLDTRELEAERAERLARAEAEYDF